MNPHSSRYHEKTKSSNFNYAYYSSKSQLLSWASSILEFEITSIDQTTTGAIFCQLLDACHPGSVKLNKVNWKANCETEYISNFKIFQQGLNENNINKSIDVFRLANGKQYELNELLQWIYGYYLNYKDNYQGPYNAKKRRNGQNLIFTKHNFRKKPKLQIIKDNYSQASYSSKNSYNSDNVNFLSDNIRNNNRGDLVRSHSRPNFQSIGQNKFNDNNYSCNNKNEKNNYRNKSKRENKNKKYFQFQNQVLENPINNSNNNFQNQKNNNKFIMSKKTKNKNNIYVNNEDNNILKSQIRNNNAQRINNNNNTAYYERVNNFQKIQDNNYYNSNKTKSFSNTVENEYFSTNPFYQDYEEESKDNCDVNFQDEEDIEVENELGYTDFYGLNELETKHLMEEEEKDGNKISHLKKIIRKLRIDKISNEKEINNINNIITNINRLKNFYLNKLKDIEYLYFNPIIRNDNDNKNTMLRQILCTDQDSTIFIDENNYAYITNKNTNNLIKEKQNYFNNKSNPVSSKKNKKIEVDENNISYIIKENRMNLEQDNQNNLNYSSKKNFNNNYINNMFESWNDNTESINKNNNESFLNLVNSQNNLLYRNDGVMNNYNISNNTTQFNCNNETQSNSLFNNNFDYNQSEKSKMKTQKIIPIKMNSNCDNKENAEHTNIINQIQNNLEISNNINNDSVIWDEKQIKHNHQFGKNTIENGKYDLKNNNWLYNGGKSLPQSGKKVNNFFDIDQRDYENDKNFINKTQFKSNSSAYDITSQVLNDSLHIKGI